MVDDQVNTYSVGALQKLKADHEAWVARTLAGQVGHPRARVRRIKENIPSHLGRLETGNALLSVLDGACAFSFDHDEPTSEEEMELLAAFFQEAQDWGDLDLESGEKVRVAFHLTTLIGELKEAGFWLFGAREERRLEGGAGPPTSFPVAIVQVLRTTNPTIVKTS